MDIIEWIVFSGLLIFGGTFVIACLFANAYKDEDDGRPFH